jgi:adenosylcobinamide-GDP ribazoletransferase
MALRFFSRLPTGSSPHLPPDLGRIAPVLPVASLLMGTVPALLILLTALGLPPYFAATLAVAAMVIVNGGMMEDALADAADGLFGGTTAARRLEIFRDSRHGTFGVAALCLLLLLRVTAIGGVAAADPVAAAALWLAANILGRSGGLWLAAALPPARSDGAAATAGTLSASRFATGAALAAGLGAIALALVTSFAMVLVAVAAVALVALGWTALCRRLVGGQTGDLIGAAGALGEIAALVALLFFV